MIILPGLLSAQAGDSLSSDITTEKKRLVILPAEDDTDEEGFSISAEVNRAVATVAARLGRFEIIDRNDLESILQEQDLALLGLVDDSAAVEIGRIAAAQEALRVTVLNFHQVGVPKDSDDDDDDENLGAQIFGGLIKAALGLGDSGNNKLDPYRDNIQTQISIDVTNLDIETGQTLYAFRTGASHTGGGKGKSREKAMTKLRLAINTELRKFYSLESRVVAVRGNELFLPLGSGIGLTPGMLFTIIEPARTETFGDLKIEIPGRPVAYVKVKEVSETGNRSQVLRRWADIHEGYPAQEHIAPLWAVQIDARPGFSTAGNVNQSFGARFNLRAVQSFDFGIGLRYASTIDSRDKNDPGIEFSLLAGNRYHLSPGLVFYAHGELGFSPFFRDDDAGNSVNTGVGYFALGADLELVRSQGKDLVLGAAWRFGGSNDKWTYSEGDGDNRETFDAEWVGTPPEVDISGLFITLGYRFIFPGIRLPSLPIPGM
ncbi:MAG: CsgG/HfaB family protein [Candidatus Neomarinimicrobiota bacterium]